MNWHAMFSGSASTPAWVVKEGETFKDAQKGEVVCTFPETTTRTAEKTAERVRLIIASPGLLRFAEAVEQVVLSSGHNLCSTATAEERTRFISGIIDAWNNGGYEALDQTRGCSHV